MSKTHEELRFADENAGDPVCGERNAEGLGCCLLADHRGPDHVATTGYNRIVARWPRVHRLIDEIMDLCVFVEQDRDGSHDWSALFLVEKIRALADTEQKS